MLKYCRAQSGQTYPGVHLDIWLTRYPYLWDIELNTRRGTPSLQAIKYYFVYFINTFAFTDKKRNKLMNELTTEKKRIQNQLSAGELRFKMKNCVESFQKQTMDVTFNSQNPQLLPFFVLAGGLWKTFQLSIFVLSHKKSRYQSQLTYGSFFRILVSFRFYNRRPNCWHIHFFNPLLLQIYLLFPSVS